MRETGVGSESRTGDGSGVGERLRVADDGDGCGCGCGKGSIGKGGSNVNELLGRRAVWIMGLESESGMADIGLARGSGERGRGDAMQVCVNETGGHSGEDERDDAAECCDDEGRQS